MRDYTMTRFTKHKTSRMSVINCSAIAIEYAVPEISKILVSGLPPLVIVNFISDCACRDLIVSPPGPTRTKT
ncbi:hypothetical protein HanIR_Chr14g0683541 [Helianthus annuus]|nr:hypothetical protein HanIR_Chr14g0683541 [Helianthus annuus]